jgi:hypothetical protein
MERGDLNAIAEVMGPVTQDRPAVKATDLAARAQQRMKEGAEGAAGDLAGQALACANSDDGYWRARALLDQRWRAEEDLASATATLLKKRREVLVAEAELLEAAQVSRAGAGFVMSVFSDDPGAAPPLDTEDERSQRLELEAGVKTKGGLGKRFSRALHVVAGTALVVVDIGAFAAQVVTVPSVGLEGAELATASVGAGLKFVRDGVKGD